MESLSTNNLPRSEESQDTKLQKFLENFFKNIIINYSKKTECTHQDSKIPVIVTTIKIPGLGSIIIDPGHPDCGINELCDKYLNHNDPYDKSLVLVIDGMSSYGKTAVFTRAPIEGSDHLTNCLIYQNPSNSKLHLVQTSKAYIERTKEFCEQEINRASTNSESIISADSIGNVVGFIDHHHPNNGPLDPSTEIQIYQFLDDALSDDPKTIIGKLLQQCINNERKLKVVVSDSDSDNSGSLATLLIKYALPKALKNYNEYKDTLFKGYTESTVIELLITLSSKQDKFEKLIFVDGLRDSTGGNLSNSIASKILEIPVDEYQNLVMQLFSINESHNRCFTNGRIKENRTLPTSEKPPVSVSNVAISLYLALSRMLNALSGDERKEKLIDNFTIYTTNPDNGRLITKIIPHSELIEKHDERLEELITSIRTILSSPNLTVTEILDNFNLGFSLIKRTSGLYHSVGLKPGLIHVIVNDPLKNKYSLSSPFSELSNITSLLYPFIAEALNLIEEFYTGKRTWFYRNGIGGNKNAVYGSVLKPAQIKLVIPYLTATFLKNLELDDEPISDIPNSQSSNTPQPPVKFKLKKNDLISVNTAVKEVIKDILCCSEEKYSFHDQLNSTVYIRSIPQADSPSFVYHVLYISTSNDEISNTIHLETSNLKTLNSIRSLLRSYKPGSNTLSLADLFVFLSAEQDDEQNSDELASQFQAFINQLVYNNDEISVNQLLDIKQEVISR